MALIGLALMFGAATQVVDPPAAGDVIAEQLDEAVVPAVVLGIAEPTRTTTIAVYRREPSIGRIASYAPFRPPRAPAIAS